MYLENKENKKSDSDFFRSILQIAFNGDFRFLSLEHDIFYQNQFGRSHQKNTVQD